MSEENIELSEEEKNEQQLLAAMSQQMNLVDYVVKAGEPLEEGSPKASMDDIISALKTVSDPEISINVWDMGLIYKVEPDEKGDVYIEMTVTAPTCPVAGILPGQVADAVSALSGVGCVTVKLVWEPAWSFERLSDEAKMMFELF